MPKVKHEPKINYFPTTHNEHILVVDDESMIRESLKDILQSLGYKTFLASGGAEAITILEKNRDIQLAIVDFIMPQMNGIVTTKELKKINPNIKVLLSSGQADRQGLLNGSTQIDGFLLKPYHISELELKIHQLLKRSALSNN
jgi:CheY-like chemotaxis protein